MTKRPLIATREWLYSAGAPELCLVIVVRVITMQIPAQELEADIVLVAEVNPELIGDGKRWRGRYSSFSMNAS